MPSQELVSLKDLVNKAQTLLKNYPRVSTWEFIPKLVEVAKNTPVNLPAAIIKAHEEMVSQSNASRVLVNILRQVVLVQSDLLDPREASTKIDALMLTFRSEAAPGLLNSWKTRSEYVEEVFLKHCKEFQECIQTALQSAVEMDEKDLPITKTYSLEPSPKQIQIKALKDDLTARDKKIAGLEKEIDHAKAKIAALEKTQFTPELKLQHETALQTLEKQLAAEQKTQAAAKVTIADLEGQLAAEKKLLDVTKKEKSELEKSLGKEKSLAEEYKKDLAQAYLRLRSNNSVEKADLVVRDAKKINDWLKKDDMFRELYNILPLVWEEYPALKTVLINEENWSVPTPKTAAAIAEDRTKTTVRAKADRLFMRYQDFYSRVLYADTLADEKTAAPKKNFEEIEQEIQNIKRKIQLFVYHTNSKLVPNSEFSRLFKSPRATDPVKAQSVTPTAPVSGNTDVIKRALNFFDSILEFERNREELQGKYKNCLGRKSVLTDKLVQALAEKDEQLRLNWNIMPASRFFLSDPLRSATQQPVPAPQTRLNSLGIQLTKTYGKT